MLARQVEANAFRDSHSLSIDILPSKAEDHDIAKSFLNSGK